MKSRFLVEVSYRKRLKKITLLRYLCSKIVYEVDKIQSLDLIVLYDALLWAQMKSNNDGAFRKNFGKSLELLAEILKRNPAIGRVYHKSLAEKLRREFDKNWDFLFPPRNYPAVKERMSGNYHLIRAKQPGKPIKSFPPKRFIGKGYGDKGTLRNPAVDGSPAWQEIACSAEFQLSEILRKLVNERRYLTIEEQLNLQDEAENLLDQLGK